MPPAPTLPAAAPAVPVTLDGRSAGGTVWLTGLPSAGKSTVADEVATRLRARGRAVEVLDGDGVRAALSGDLGFAREDRARQVARVGWVARLLARHGVVVLAPLVSPYAADRDALRAASAAEGLVFLEVHVAAPVEVCSDRDVKGLYARQRAGQMTGLTGVDDPYEPPQRPDLALHTEAEPLAASADRLLALLATRGLA